MRGRERAWLNTRSGNVEARSLLGRAVTISLDFAAAHEFVGFTHVNDYINGWAEVPEESLKIGLEIAERAVQLDEAEPQGRYVLAVALGSIDRPTERLPRRAVVSIWHLTSRKDITQSLVCSPSAVTPPGRSIRLMPTCVSIRSIRTWRSIFWLKHNFRWVSSTRRSRPSNSVSGVVPIQRHLWLCLRRLGHLGKIQEARAAWAEVMKIAPNFSIERQRRVLPYRIQTTSSAASRDCEKRIFHCSGLAKQNASCRRLALHDSPPFSDRPSLTGHCGHGWTCSYRAQSRLTRCGLRGAKQPT